MQMTALKQRLDKLVNTVDTAKKKEETKTEL